MQSYWVVPWSVCLSQIDYDEGVGRRERIAVHEMRSGNFLIFLELCPHRSFRKFSFIRGPGEELLGAMQTLEKRRPLQSTRSHYAIYGTQPLSGCQTISVEGRTRRCMRALPAGSMLYHWATLSRPPFSFDAKIRMETWPNSRCVFLQEGSNKGDSAPWPFLHLLLLSGGLDHLSPTRLAPSEMGGEDQEGGRSRCAEKSGQEESSLCGGPWGGPRAGGLRHFRSALGLGRAASMRSRPPILHCAPHGKKGRDCLDMGSCSSWCGGAFGTLLNHISVTCQQIAFGVLLLNGAPVHRNRPLNGSEALRPASHASAPKPRRLSRVVGSMISRDIAAAAHV